MLALATFGRASRREIAKVIKRTRYKSDGKVAAGTSEWRGEKRGEHDHINRTVGVSGRDEERAIGSTRSSRTSGAACPVSQIFRLSPVTLPPRGRLAFPWKMHKLHQRALSRPRIARTSVTSPPLSRCEARTTSRDTPYPSRPLHLFRFLGFRFLSLVLKLWICETISEEYIIIYKKKKGDFLLRAMEKINSTKSHGVNY